MTGGEARAVWISRFDWGEPPLQRARLEYLIGRAADAGFNIVLFQVRGTGDAYYTPGLEPWSYRLTSASPSTLGADPGWDPLAAAVEAAHSRGIQLHAYLNLYPIWECGQIAPPHTVPEHPYWSLGNDRADPYQYDSSWRVHANTNIGAIPMSDSEADLAPCHEYVWASPGVERVNLHNLAVVLDIVARYAVDGIHFDRVRYPGRHYSVDPESVRRWRAVARGGRFMDWQRDNLSAWMDRIHTDLRALNPDVTVSAAVWFTHKKTAAMNFATSQGYYDYYQDSHRWLGDGSLEALAPMLYGDPFNADIEKWKVLADSHVAVQGDRQVWLGIGAQIAPFAGVAERIAYARRIGAAGVAFWSAGALDANRYWDDLRAGAFRKPAQPP